MVKHVILWQLKDSFTEEEKTEIKAGIKAGLEGLAGQIPGLLSIQVHTEGLPSSNADLMLDSCFADAASAGKCPARQAPPSAHKTGGSVRV